MTNALHTLAVETDTALADLYKAAAATRDRLGSIATSVLHLAGAEFYYRGRRRVTDMNLVEAEAIVAAELRKLEAHRAAHEGESGLWVGYVGRVAPHDQDRAERAVAGLAEQRAELARIEAEMEPLEAVHAEHGWSRFFLVTSSQGHVHSSMSCSTCRPTTTYGWLPELSGQSEAEAVDQLGPNLCSVCFPSAPVEWVGGKLTKSQATKAAH